MIIQRPRCTPTELVLSIFVLGMCARSASSQNSDMQLLNFVMPSIANSKFDQEVAIDRLQQAIEQLSEFNIDNYHAETAIGWGRRFSPLGTVGMEGGDGNTHEGFQLLVKGGCDSIPLLLNHISDTRPTKSKVSELVKPSTKLNCAHELFGNPLNRFEEGLIWKQDTELLPSKALMSNEVSPHDILNIGDVCAMALGQIVSRDFAPIRPLSHFKGEPFCFPFSRSRALQEKVRSAWLPCCDHRKLLESYLIDFYTRDKKAPYNELAGDYDSESSDFVCNAALRLLYFFPDIGTRVLVGEIESIKGDADFAKGVHLIDLINCVQPFKYPKLRTAVVDLGKRAQDEAIVAVVEKVLEAKGAVLLELPDR
jgi:hypothetical protein